MRIAVIPAAWLAVADTWDAKTLIDLAVAARRRRNISQKYLKPINVARIEIHFTRLHRLSQKDT